MSNGGVFALINNDGKQDKMFLATELLNRRLRELEQQRAGNPRIRDPTPTLTDIEKTHILFVNSHFKPYASIMYEYNKVAPQNGQAKLDGSVKFSIPQYGDFFNDMVLHVKLGKVEAEGADYWDSPSDNLPSPSLNGGANQLLRYVDYLGQRLIKKFDFEINGNHLDEYNSEIMNMHSKFFVTPNKRTGWERNVGQEQPKLGYSNVGVANGRSGRGSGVREKRVIYDGPQTPKPVQEEVEMWIPLLFWFNKDPRLSIPSVAIPYGQRDINVDIAKADEVLQHVHAHNPALDAPARNPVPVPEIRVFDLYINNIFVLPEIHDIYIKRIGFSMIRVHRFYSAQTKNESDTLKVNPLKFPVETLYIGMRPNENHDVRSTKMLEDWHLYSQVEDKVVSSGALRDYALLDADVALDTTVASVETGLGFADGSDADEVIISACGTKLNGIQTVTGAAAGAQATVTLLNQWLGYYGFKLLDEDDFVNAAVPTLAEVNTLWPEPGRGGAGCTEIRYKNCTPTLDTIELQLHNVNIYKKTDSGFFNSYTTYTYGGANVNTPEDCGALMMPFNLYPGTYQPSGYINFSRAREIDFNYTSSYLGQSGSSNLTATVIIIGIALNFLLVSDGSAVLRYAT